MKNALRKKMTSDEDQEDQDMLLHILLAISDLSSAMTEALFAFFFFFFFFFEK